MPIDSHAHTRYLVSRADQVIETRNLIDLMEARPKIDTLPMEEARAGINRMLEDDEADPPEVSGVEDGDFMGATGRIGFRRYRPLGVSGGLQPTLIYYHGGGFIAGSLDTHDSTCRRLANKSRCQLIAIDYRLSPEHTFPAPTDDGVAAFRHIRDNAARFDASGAQFAKRGHDGGGSRVLQICFIGRRACQRGGKRVARSV